MDPVNAIVMLLHPLLASALLVWVWWQYSWRKKSHELKGEDRTAARSRHERMGERLLWSTLGVILVAFLARAVVGQRTNGDVLSYLMPQSLHGFMGPVGFALFWQLSRMGKRAKIAREQGDSFSNLKLKHGRMADLVVALVFIHAFLGFLYIFAVL